MVPKRLVPVCLTALVSCLAAPGVASAQFANNCPTAPNVGTGQFTFDLRTAPANLTFEPDCADESSPFHKQFVRFTAPSTGTYFLRVPSIQDGEISLSVYNACPAGPGSVACNSTASCGADTLVKLSATAGQSFVILVAGFFDGQPFGSVSIALAPPAPPGDTCATAAPTGLGTVNFDLENSRNDGDFGEDVWFVYVPAANGGLTANFCDIGEPAVYGTGISLYSGCLPEEILDNASTTIAFPQCRTATAVQAGVPVYIQVSTQCSRAGQFTLAFQPGVAPANDLCANAATIGEGRTTINNSFATTDGIEPCPAGAFGEGGKDLWYAFTPAVSGPHYFQATPAGELEPIAYLTLAVLDGCDGFPIGCANTGFSGADFLVTLDAGVRYVIRVAGNGRLADGRPYARGEATLDIERFIPPANDACANAQPIGAGEFDFNLRTATPDGVDSCPVDPAAPATADVWFRYTPAFSGPAEVGLVVDPDEPNLISAADVSIVASCGGPTVAGGSVFTDPDTFAYRSRLAFQAVAGQPVLVRIGGNVFLDQPGGTGRFYAGAVRAPAPPANDTCAGATTLAPGTTPFSLVNSSKSCPPPFDSPAFTPCTSATADDIYFRFVAPATGNATLAVADGALFPFGGVVLSVILDCTGTPVACGLEFGDAPLDAIAFPVQAGQAYLVALGAYVGDGTQTGTLTLTLPGGNPCPADFNGSGVVDVSDIFAFLSAWFAQGPGSDFNGSGETDVSDIFAFLSAWFAGC